VSVNDRLKQRLPLNLAQIRERKNYYQLERKQETRIVISALISQPMDTQNLQMIGIGYISEMTRL
jgi:CHASE1-domain containing sensor protein